MSLYPPAKHRILDRFKTPMVSPERINLHTAVSNSSDIYSTFDEAGETASHFYVNEIGDVIQYVDTMYEAAADYRGNRSTISIETWDGMQDPIPGFNPAQMNALIDLIEWIFTEHPTVPIKLAQDSLPGPTSQGLSWHRLGVPYRTSTEATLLGKPSAYKEGYLKDGGIWYSKSAGKTCPGDAKISQIPEILKHVIENTHVVSYSVEYVMDIQRLLNAADPEYNLTIDGELRLITTTAVADFQKKHGLVVDGDPGPLTLSKLKQLQEATVSIVRNIDPYPGKVTSHFSTLRKNPATGVWSAHLGSDIAPVPSGSSKPVRAFQAGTVVAVGTSILSGRTGTGTIIQHTPTFRTYYGHLATVNVSKGQAVSAGTVIGIGGKTGNVTGVHLHFEMHYLKNGKWVAVNPWTEAKKYGITLGAGGSAGQVETLPGGNDEDRRIQQALKDMGFYNGIVDGQKGNLQIAATKAFQAYVGITTDGDWRSQTQARYEALGRPSSRDALNLALNPAQNGTDNDRNIQKALANMGLYTGIIDGVNGPVQKSAVSEFQRIAGITIDGDWRSQTQARYEALGRPGTRAALDAAVNPTIVLKKGVVRGEVGSVQRALKAHKYTKQIIDNIFGAQTDVNIRDFQRRQNLVVDGVVVVGGVTWRRLGL